jgi:uncharacterized protein (DUF305 family)
LTTLAVGACGNGSSAMNPLEPSAIAGQGGATRDMSAMAGMGMGPGRGMGMGVSSEFDFLARMIPHHDEAIAAARELQRGTQRQEMRTFAVSIIQTQTAEVERMKAWLALWYPDRETHVSYQPMMRDLTLLGGNALDQAFLEDMIPHHMMAVMMSQQLLRANLASHAEVIPFARNIRDVQHDEIRTMGVWLRDWFGTAAGMGMAMP